MLSDVYKFHTLNYPKLSIYMGTLVVTLVLLLVKVVDVHHLIIKKFIRSQ